MSNEQSKLLEGVDFTIDAARFKQETEKAIAASASASKGPVHRGDFEVVAGALEQKREEVNRLRDCSGVLAILVALEAGALSEGQAAKAARLDRVTLRKLRDQAIELAAAAVKGGGL